MVKAVTLFLILLVVLAVIGRLRFRQHGPRRPGAARCPACGRPRIGNGRCPCGGRG